MVGTDVLLIGAARWQRWWFFHRYPHLAERRRVRRVCRGDAPGVSGPHPV